MHGHKRLRVGPKTLAGDKCIMQAIARQRFELSVIEMLFLSRAGKFARDLRARNAFVIGSQGYRHTILKIYEERMLLAFNAENDIITRETSFNHDLSACHFPQQ